MSDKTPWNLQLIADDLLDLYEGPLPWVDNEEVLKEVSKGKCIYIHCKPMSDTGIDVEKELLKQFRKERDER